MFKQIKINFIDFYLILIRKMSTNNTSNNKQLLENRLQQLKQDVQRKDVVLNSLKQQQQHHHHHHQLPPTKINQNQTPPIVTKTTSSTKTTTDPRIILLSQIRELKNRIVNRSDEKTLTNHKIKNNAVITNKQDPSSFSSIRDLCISLATQLEHEALKFYLARDVRLGQEELCQELYKQCDALVMTLITTSIAYDFIKPLQDQIWHRCNEACIAVEKLVEAIISSTTPPPPPPTNSNTTNNSQSIAWTTSAFEVLKTSIAGLPITNRAAVKRTVLETIMEIDDSVREFSQFVDNTNNNDEEEQFEIEEVLDDDEQDFFNGNNNTNIHTGKRQPITEEDKQRMTCSIQVLKSLKDYLKECGNIITSHDLQDSNWFEQTHNQMMQVRNAYLDFGVEMYPPFTFENFSRSATKLMECVTKLQQERFQQQQQQNVVALNEYIEILRKQIDLACI
jgi:hypothetical protein